MTKEQLVLEILNQLQEGILAVDEREDIIFFNNSACGILGVEKDAVLYKNVVDTIPNTRLHIILRTGVSELDRLQ
ncbi:MAG TPA: PAS domain-containing protein, partial [Petrotogaceae bacterium]|nr:PAS domain-containing protein [Petrotogaceae bacterium]